MNLLPRPAALRGVVVAATVAACVLSVAPAAQAHDRGGRPSHGSGPAGTFAVIGDLPYGQAAIDALPEWIGDINADPDVTSVAHLGDIKSGSARCDDDYFDAIREQFDTFVDPLVYTPGDNEWTDCHRANNGGYNPLERLGALRSTFFNRPFVTLGQQAMRVSSQAWWGLPENVRYERYGLSFAALHVVGSNNDLAPWNGTDASITEPNILQIIEQTYRMYLTIHLMKEAFAAARLHHDRAVVLMMQADMFESNTAFKDASAFQPLVRELTRQSARFDGEVYLFNGDSHEFETDQPLAAGSPWLDYYGVSGAADNLTRVTVDGSGNAGKGYLKVTVAGRSQPGPVLSWTQVPYAVQP